MESMTHMRRMPCSASSCIASGMISAGSRCQLMKRRPLVRNPSGVLGIASAADALPGVLAMPADGSAHVRARDEVERAEPGAVKVWRDVEDHPRRHPCGAPQALVAVAGGG